MYNHRNESISVCSPVTVLIEHGASNIRAISLIPRDHTYGGKMCTLSASDALDKCINVNVHFTLDSAYAAVNEFPSHRVRHQ